MEYTVVMTIDAENDFDRHISYIVNQKKNLQAAGSVIEDFVKPKAMLSKVAGSLQPCTNTRLNKLGYRRVN